MKTRMIDDDDDDDDDEDDDDGDDDLQIRLSSGLWPRFFRCLSRVSISRVSPWELHGPSRSISLSGAETRPLNTANPCMNPMFFFLQRHCSKSL